MLLFRAITDKTLLLLKNRSYVFINENDLLEISIVDDVCSAFERFIVCVAIDSKNYQNKITIFKKNMVMLK